MKKKLKKITPSMVFLWFFLLISLFPFYVMIVGAFKPHKALSMIPPDLNILSDLTLKNADYVLHHSSLFQWLGNSFLISTGTVLITVLISATAGYAFARKTFRGKNLFFMIVIATMILPRQMLLIPNYLVAMNLGLTNKLIGVILTSVAPSFGIFLCRQFMQNIPTELTEAAEIDGCGEIRKFLTIIIPLSAPALGALSIFSFLGTWNDFLWQFIMIQDKTKQTVPVGISMFAQQFNQNFGYQLVAACFATVPVLIIFLLCQKFFIKGITMGGVKG